MDEQEWLASEDPAAMLRHLTHETLQTWTIDGAQANAVEQERESPLASPRKLRLFACALWRLALSRAGAAREPALWEARERLALSVRSAELWADGKPTRPNNGYAVLEAGAAKAANDTVRAPSICHAVPSAEQAALLRNVVGNPWRPVKLPLGPCLHCGKAIIASNQNIHLPGPCPWLTPAVLSLASAAYLDRLHDGALDPLTLLAVADALEEAGCDSAGLLWHLRGLEVCPDCFDGPDGASVYCRRCEGSGRAGWIPLRGPHCPGCHVVDLILGKE